MCLLFGERCFYETFDKILQNYSRHGIQTSWQRTEKKKCKQQNRMRYNLWKLCFNTKKNRTSEQHWKRPKRIYQACQDNRQTNASPTMAAIDLWLWPISLSMDHSRGKWRILKGHNTNTIPRWSSFQEQIATVRCQSINYLWSWLSSWNGRKIAFRLHFCISECG